MSVDKIASAPLEICGEGVFVFKKKSESIFFVGADYLFWGFFVPAFWSERAEVPWPLTWSLSPGV